MRKVYFIGPALALMLGSALMARANDADRVCTEDHKAGEYNIVCTSTPVNGYYRVYWHNGTVGGTYIHNPDGTHTDQQALSYDAVLAFCGVK